MWNTIYRSVMTTFILLVLCCGLYPLLVTGLGIAFFPDQANGGLIRKGGVVIGARLIGQAFSKPEYFHGRPSFAGNGYDAENSSGSNLGPTNQKLSEIIHESIERTLVQNPGVQRGQLPVDLVTSSASGLDPDISPEAARIQIQRVAMARGLNIDQVKKIVEDRVISPQWGVFGEFRVNVLELNLALDATSPK